MKRERVRPEGRPLEPYRDETIRLHVPVLDSIAGVGQVVDRRSLQKPQLESSYSCEGNALRNHRLSSRNSQVRLMLIDAHFRRVEDALSSPSNDIGP